MKEIWNGRSRLMRSLAGLLAVLMVVTSVDLSTISASAEELEPQETVTYQPTGGVGDTDEALSETQTEAADTEISEEVIPGEEERYDASQSKAVTLDLGEIWGSASNNIYICDQGYCIGAYDSNTNPYTSFSSLTLTGMVTNYTSMIWIAGAPEGATVILDDLQILTHSYNPIFCIGGDITLNIGENVRLEAFSGNGQSANTFDILNGTVTITGSGDLNWKSTISGAYPFVYFENSGSAFVTKDYTGNIYLDSQCGSTAIFSGYGNVSLDTTGTIEILGGTESAAFTNLNSVTLSGSEITLSKANGDQFIDADSDVTITAAGDINLNNDCYLPFIQSGGKVILDAGGDINYNASDLNYMVNANAADIKAGGTLNIEVPDYCFGYDAQKSNSCYFFYITNGDFTLETKGDLTIHVNQNFFYVYGGTASVNIGGDLDLAGYYAYKERYRFTLGTYMFCQKACVINVAGDMSVKGDFSSVFTGSGSQELELNVGGKLTIDDLYANSSAFNGKATLNVGGDTVISGYCTNCVIAGSAGFALTAGGSVTLAQVYPAGQTSGQPVTSAPTVIKAGKDVTLTSNIGQLSTSTLSIEAGDSVNLTVTKEGSLFYAAIAGDTSITAGKDISFSVPSSNYAISISQGNLYMSAKGIIELKNTYKGRCLYYVKNKAEFRDAEKLILTAEGFEDSGALFYGNTIIDIPGDVEIIYPEGTQPLKLSSGGVLTVDNARNVTVTGDCADDNNYGCGLIRFGGLNITGTLTVANASGCAYRINGDDVPFKAGAIDVSANSASYAAVTGGSWSCEADSVSIVNNESGEALAGNLDVTSKSVKILGSVSGNDYLTDISYSSKTAKAASIVDADSTRIFAYCEAEHAASPDDVDVEVYYEGTKVSEDLYTVTLNKSSQDNEYYDLVTITAKNPADTAYDIYLTGSTDGSIEFTESGDAVASVASEIRSEEKEFTSLYSALDYAGSLGVPATVKILKDCDFGTDSAGNARSYTMPDGADITLDLNNCNVTGTAKNLFVIPEYSGGSDGSRLTITDTSEEQNGALYNTNESDGTNESAYVIYNSNQDSVQSVLNIEAGQIWSLYGAYAVYLQAANVNVSGGTIYGFYAYLGDAERTITGGTFMPRAVKDDYSITFAKVGSPTLNEIFTGECKYGLRRTADDTWLSSDDLNGTNVMNYTNAISCGVYVAERTDIATVKDAFGSLAHEYYYNVDAVTAGELSGYGGEGIEGITYTEWRRTNYTKDGLQYCSLVLTGNGGYYGTVAFDYICVKNDSKPLDSYTVENTCYTTADADVLPAHWHWKDETELVNTGDVTPNEAIAVYAYTVTGDTGGAFAEKTVKLYRDSCVHVQSERLLYPDRNEYTCGYYTCSCGDDGCSNCYDSDHEYEYSCEWSECTASKAVLRITATCIYCGYKRTYDRTSDESGFSKTVYSDYCEWMYNGFSYPTCRVYNSGYQVAFDESISYIYTGTQIKPAVTVYYDGTKLTEGKDYTLSYANNIKANIDNDGNKLLQGYNKKTKTYYELVPTITVKGKGSYTGTMTVNFDIRPASCSWDVEYEMNGVGGDNNIFAAPAKGKSVSLFKSVTLNGVKVSADDYTITVTDSDGNEVSLKDIAPGEYTWKLTGKNNLCDTTSGSFTVSAATYSLADAKITLKNNRVSSIKIGSKSFALSNFEIEYPSAAASKLPGEHEITITPIASKLGSTFLDEPVTVTYTVQATAINSKWFSLAASSVVYNGSEQEVGVLTTAKAPQGLTENFDYKISYTSNTNAGKATVTITGINNYRGTVKLTFKIEQASLNTVGDVTCNETAAYSKAGTQAENLRVKDTGTGKLLTQGTDYTVSYKNNTKLGTATAVVKGKGNYTGSLTQNFKVTAKSLLAEDVTAVAADMTYKKDGAYKAAVTVYDGTKKLKSGTDYTVTYEPHALGVSAEEILDNGGYIILEAIITGKGAYATTKNGEPETISAYYRVGTEKVSSLKITVDATNACYAEGAEIRPTVKVQYGVKVGLKTVYYTLNSSQYTVSYTNNTSAGTGKVTVTGTKKYIGSKTVSFKIKAHTIK